MKSHLKSAVAVIGFFLFGIAAQALADCDDAWEKYSDDNTRNEYLTYRSRSVSTINGNDYVSESTLLQTVLSSNRDVVHWQYATTVNNMVTVTEAAVTRAQYVNNCDSSVEVDHGDETITVAAGRFATTWRRFRFEQNGAVTVSKSWTASLDSGEEVVVGTIIYKFSPDVLAELGRTGAIQQSFLLVHEWLRDLTTNDDLNRRLNRYLHSADFDRSSKDVARAQIAGIGLPLSSSTSNTGNSGKVMLVAGGDGTCIVVGDKIDCWGRLGNWIFDDYLKQLPGLRNPRALGLSHSHLCVLDDDGVKCVGSVSYPRALKVPALRHPREIAVGSGATCALDDLGIQCWGENAFALKNRPTGASFANLKLSYMGCVLADEELQCFGHGLLPASSFDIPRPAVGAVRDYAVGPSHICTAAPSSEVTCFGANAMDQSVSPPLFGPVRQLALGAEHSCALYEDQTIFCWGGANDWKLTVPPRTRSPTIITAGMSHTCILDEVGVKCWGSNGANQLDVPKKYAELFKNQP